MGRRSRAGDEALGMLIMVCGGIGTVLFGPIALGYFWPTWGLGFVAAEVLFALLAFHPRAAGFRFAAWAQGHPLGFGAALLFFASLVVTGVVTGADARVENAREEAERSRIEQANLRWLAERAQAERDAQARREAEQRQREEAERAAEARRTPQDRAAIASAILGGSGELHDRVCRARVALARVRPEDRSVPEVRAASRLLTSAERADLRELRANFREGRSIMCSDGWISSCECSRSNRRGCCSWHGGIRGCEPLPTEITCPDQR